MPDYTATPVRLPQDIYMDLRAIARHRDLVAPRDVYEMADLIAEFCESMEAYQTVLYQP